LARILGRWRAIGKAEELSKLRQRWKYKPRHIRAALLHFRVMKGTFLTKLRVQWDHLKSVAEIRRHFENPWLIVLFRLGVIKSPYFLHRVRKESRSYAMLARPTTTSCADLFVLREVLVEEAYKAALALLTVKNIRLVDIGANFGSFTIWAHGAAGVREAFCFEPEPDSFRLLNFNLSLNDCSAAKTLACAVGGESRMIKISLKKSSPGGTTIYDGDTSPEAKTVPVIAFEKWLGEVEGDFDLLKMDCEGAEWEIIRRTDPRQFARFQVVVAEVHEDPEHKQAVPEFKQSMENLGFRTVRWDNKAQGLYVGTRNAAAAA
jgi:FkbM family methyltransferase